MEWRVRKINKCEHQPTVHGLNSYKRIQRAGDCISFDTKEGYESLHKPLLLEALPHTQAEQT